MRIKKAPRGFSVPELMIVMTIMAVLSTVLLAMYSQSELALSRGVTLTTLEQHARLAAARIIPKITSAVVRPADGTNALIPGIVVPAAPVAPAEWSGSPGTGAESLPPTDTTTARPWQVVLNSIEPYVQRQLRQTESTFNPRSPSFREYRLFYAIDANKDQSSEDEAPGGRVGNVWIDGNTPTNSSDDILVASNLYEARFEREPDNVIRLIVVTKGWARRAIGGRTLLERRYQTRIHLPIYTYTPGGS